MYSEELVEAGVAASLENIPQGTSSHVAEDVLGSGSREEGEIGSGVRTDDGEDISNVEVNLNELISLKGSYPPSVVFGRSKITKELIKEYEEAGFFPSGDGHPPSNEETPSPMANEIVVFRDFFHLWSQISM
jgi:hypothetical protein